MKTEEYFSESNYTGYHYHEECWKPEYEFFLEKIVKERKDGSWDVFLDEPLDDYENNVLLLVRSTKKQRQVFYKNFYSTILPNPTNRIELKMKAFYNGGNNWFHVTRILLLLGMGNIARAVSLVFHAFLFFLNRKI